MKLTPDTALKHKAGFRNGCFCRFKMDASDAKRRRCIRTPVMGCPVHETKTLIIDDPEKGGSEAGAYQAAGYADAPAAEAKPKLLFDPISLLAFQVLADAQERAMVDEAVKDARTHGVLKNPPPPPTVPPFVHGRLGEAELGRLFYIVCDGPNDITLTGQGLALRMDRATLTALWRAAADGLNHLDKRGRSS
jgi:hypothetical protein